MPTVQQLPSAVAVNLTDEIMLDQGGNSVAATVAQVLDTQPLGEGLVRSGDTLAADTTLLAPLASPAFTGAPTAPTPAAGDNSTHIATTAFVLANGGGGSGTITLTGDVTGSGSGTVSATLAAVATPGTYEKVTVDAKGRVTAGAALAQSDISTALGFIPIAGNQAITLSGDLSGSGITAITATLAAVATPGTYQSVTVDAKGRVTAGSNLVGADLSGSEVTAAGSATARTLGARANDRIDVLDYGADPTGTADSAPAFAAAMNAVVSGNWGRVFVPRGSYKLDSAVNQPAGRSIAVVFDDGADITGSGYLGVDRVESDQGPYAFWQNSGGFFGFAPNVGDSQNPGMMTELLFNTPQNSLSMRVGWDRRYTNTNIYGKTHSGIDIAEQRIHSWPNIYDNSSGWGLWEVIEGTTLDEDTAARAGLSASAELSEIDVVNNGAEAGWTWRSGMGNTTQGMSIDPWGQNGIYGGGILYTYGAVGSYDGNAGGLNQRWFCYPAVFSAGNPTASAGTLVINGTAISVTAGESLASIAAAINAAAIGNVQAAVSTWGGVVSRLVIYATTASDLGSLTLSGTALGALGLAAGTTTTPRGSYAAVIGNNSGMVLSTDQLVVNGTTVTTGGTTLAAVAAAINAAAIAGIAADTNANGNLVVTCYMPLQAGGLMLANVGGGTTLGKVGLNAGTFLPPTPPKAFATAYSDQTTPVCLSTDQIAISATDAVGTVHGPVTVTLSGGAGTGWPIDVAASITAALTAAGWLSSDFTALSTGSAVVAVRAVGVGGNQGVQLRNTAGGTLTLADAHGTPLETLGIAAGTYQPGGYSAGSQTVFMAAEDAIAPGGRGVFIGGVSNATDPTVYPHTPLEARGGFLHGLRLDKATFNDGNAIVVAPTHAIAWGSKAQGQSVLTVSSGTLAFNGTPLVSSGALDALLGSEVGDVAVRTSAGWVALAPGAQGQVLEANGLGTPLSWVTALPNLAAGTVLASSGTAGVAGTITASGILTQLGSTYGDMLYCGPSSGWMALTPGATGQVLVSGGPGAAPGWAAASVEHEKFVLSIPGPLSAATQYWTVPIVDAAVVPAGWNAPSSGAACSTAAAATATALTVSYVRAGATTAIGTVTFGVGSTAGTLAGPGAAITLEAGDLLIAATGATVDATLANVGFTMTATKE